MGGAELSVHRLVTSLVTAGVTAEVISLNDGRQTNVEVVDCVQVTRVANPNIYNQFEKRQRPASWKLAFALLDNFNPLVLIRLRKMLKRSSPDVVSAHNLKGLGIGVWLAARSLGIPVVHFVHDYWLLCATSTMFKGSAPCDAQCRSCRLLTFPRRLASVIPSAVGFVSAHTRSAHQSAGYFGGTPVRVIYNARPAAPHAEVLAERKQGGFLRVGFIGRIDRTKGLGTLFEAANHLGDAIELHIAGNDHEGLLSEYRARFPSVRCRAYGFLPPPELYARVDVVVVPSIWNEPLGNVAFEPWDFSVPTIVSDAGGLPEVVGHNQSQIFPAGDFVALARQLDRFRRDPEWRKAMIAHCRAMRARFLPETQAIEYFALVDSARSESRR